MYNIGVIGAGKIAIEHLKVISNISKLNLYGITSKSNKNAEKLSKKFNIKKVFKNYIELAKDKNIDAFLVLVPAEKIFEICNFIAKFKKPLFVEKPGGMEIKKIKKLAKIFSKHSVPNIVGYNRRFYSVFDKGLKILEKNGRINSILIEGHERLWNLKKLNIKKNYLKNWNYLNSSHTIDLLRFFGGEIKTLENYNNKKTYNYLSVMETNKKIKCIYLSDWNTSEGWSVKILGNNITLIFKPLEIGYWFNNSLKYKKIQPNKIDLKYKAGFYKQMLSFVFLIKNHKNLWPSQSLQESLKTINLVNKIYE